MKKHLILWIFTTAALIVLTACSAVPTVSPTPAPLRPQIPTETETQRLSATLAPSATPSLLPTVTKTQAPTVTQTATMTATPRPTFAGFQVQFVDYASYGMQFAFIIPGIRQNYRLDVNGQSFTCNLYDQYPDRLFCIGPVFSPRTHVKLTFLPLEGEKTPVYVSDYLIPALVTPTVDIETAKTINQGNCLVRGVNVKCETEYRVDGAGCCVVSTCVDACGYYFSVDTCPQEMVFRGICQGTPPVPLPDP